MVRCYTLRAAKGLAEVACDGSRRAMANRVGDAAEGEAEVVAADMIAQAGAVATGAAGIALSGYASLSAISIADAFSVRSADAAAVSADEITGSGAAIEVAGALRWLDALPAFAARAGAAHGAAPAAMPIVGPGVDAVGAAFGSRGTPAVAVDTGQVAGARDAARATVLLVVVEVDAFGSAQLAVAGAVSVLAVAAGARLAGRAPAPAAAAVRRVGPGVDARRPAACLAARAGLRLLLLFLLGLGSGLRAEAGPEAESGQHHAEAAAAEGAAELLGQAVELLGVHGVLVAIRLPRSVILAGPEPPRP